MNSEKIANKDIVLLIILLAVSILLSGYLFWFKSFNHLIAFPKTTTLETMVFPSIAKVDFSSSLFQNDQYKVLKTNSRPLNQYLRQRPTNPFKPASADKPMVGKILKEETGVSSSDEANLFTKQPASGLEEKSLIKGIESGQEVE